MTAPIRVFSDIRGVAFRIADDADELRSIYSRVNSDADYWTEANGKTDDLDIFNEKFETVSLIIKNFSDALNDQSDTLNKIADNYEQARQRAVSRAAGIHGFMGGGGVSGFNTGALISGAVSSILGMVGLGSVVSAYNTVSSAAQLIPQIADNPEILVTSVLGMAGLGSAVSTYYAVKDAAENVSQFRDHPENLIRTAAEAAGLGSVVDKVDTVQKVISTADRIGKTVKNGASAKDLLKTGVEKVIKEHAPFSDPDGLIRSKETISEIVDSAKALKDAISDPEKIGDYLIPKYAESVKSVSTEKKSPAGFDYKWQPGDGTVSKTRKIHKTEVGEIIDRIGFQKGKTVAPLDENGNPYSADQRSVPYDLRKKNISDESAYHRYQITETINEKTLKQKIYHSDLFDENEKRNYLKEIREYYSNIVMEDRPDGSKEKVYHTGLPGNYRPPEGTEYWEGLKMGKTAPQEFGGGESKTSGGGYEYKLPLSVETLIDLGFLKEISI